MPEAVSQRTLARAQGCGQTHVHLLLVVLSTSAESATLSLSCSIDDWAGAVIGVGAGVVSLGFVAADGVVVSVATGSSFFCFLRNRLLKLLLSWATASGAVAMMVRSCCVRA